MILPQNLKLEILMENEHIKATTNVIYKAFIKRGNALYNVTIQ